MLPRRAGELGSVCSVLQAVARCDCMLCPGCSCRNTFSGVWCWLCTCMLLVCNGRACVKCFASACAAAFAAACASYLGAGAKVWGGVSPTPCLLPRSACVLVCGNICRRTRTHAPCALLDHKGARWLSSHACASSHTVSECGLGHHATNPADALACGF